MSLWDMNNFLNYRHDKYRFKTIKNTIFKVFFMVFFFNCILSDMLRIHWIWIIYKLIASFFKRNRAISNLVKAIWLFRIWTCMLHCRYEIDYSIVSPNEWDISSPGRSFRPSLLEWAYRISDSSEWLFCLVIHLKWRWTNDRVCWADQTCCSDRWSENACWSCFMFLHRSWSSSSWLWIIFIRIFNDHNDKYEGAWSWFVYLFKRSDLLLPASETVALSWLDIVCR